jgi:hypothetical protein
VDHLVEVGDGGRVELEGDRGDLLLTVQLLGDGQKVPAFGDPIPMLTIFRLPLALPDLRARSRDLATAQGG